MSNDTGCRKLLRTKCCFNSHLSFFPLDEVIRKRLLIDGDGAGDDRRINLLVKSFIKWCNSGSQEEGYFFHCSFCTSVLGEFYQGRVK